MYDVTTCGWGQFHRLRGPLGLSDAIAHTFTELFNPELSNERGPESHLFV